MYIFEINMKRRIFETPDLFIEKKFSFNCRVNVYFVRIKVQNASNHSIFRKKFFLIGLRVSSSFKNLCRTSGRQNHWFVMCRAWWGTLRATSTPRTWSPRCGAPTSFARREKRLGILQRTIFDIRLLYQPIKSDIRANLA
jgi:hypothetical protein